MKKWNETSAKSVLSRVNGVDFVGTKSISVKYGLNGLTACSALDYLKNHCGYIAIL
jgi:hypothetical protein